MGYAQAILSFLIWGGISPILVRFIPLPAPVITFAGSAVGLAFMSMYLGPAGLRDVIVAFRAHRLRLIGYGLSFVGCSLTFYWSVKTTTLANAEITHATQALITCLVMMPILGMARPSVRGYLALSLGIVGLAVALPSDFASGAHTFGVVMGILSAVFYALIAVQVPYFEKKVRPEILQACNLVTVTACVPAATIAYLTFVGPIAPTGEIGLASVAAFLVLAVMNFIVANMFYIWSLRTVPLSHVAILGYTEPVIGIAVGALFLAEPVTAAVVIGGALVLLSSAIVMHEGAAA